MNPSIHTKVSTSRSHAFPAFLAQVFFWDWHLQIRKKGHQVSWFPGAMRSLIPVREDAYMLGIEYLREVRAVLSPQEQQEFAEGLQVVIDQLR